jgi:hypothetical protein
MEILIFGVLAYVAAYLWYWNATARQNHEDYQNLREIIREVEDIREQLDHLTKEER